MAKIELIGPKKYFDKALALLQDLGTLDIVDLSKNMEDLPVTQMEIDSLTAESRDNLQNLLTRINGIISVFKPFSTDITLEPTSILYNADNSELVREADSVLSELEDNTRKLAARKKRSRIRVILS